MYTILVELKSLSIVVTTYFFLQHSLFSPKNGVCQKYFGNLLQKKWDCCLRAVFWFSLASPHFYFADTATSPITTARWTRPIKLLTPSFRIKWVRWTSTVLIIMMTTIAKALILDAHMLTLISDFLQKSVITLRFIEVPLWKSGGALFNSCLAGLWPDLFRYIFIWKPFCRSQDSHLYVRLLSFTQGCCFASHLCFRPRASTSLEPKNGAHTLSCMTTCYPAGPP